MPEEMRRLGVETVTGATVHPVNEGQDGPHRAGIGVFRSDGSLVESTVSDRTHGASLFVPVEPVPEATRVVAGEAIYGGAYYVHYGHFLLECLQRLWWARERPDLPIVWVAPSSWAEVPPLTTWQREILEIVGIRNDVVIVTEPTTFEVLHVPDAGYRYAAWSHPQHMQFLAAYEGPPQEPGRRLWLSRTGNEGGGLLNSDIIERRLRGQGWHIVRPELLPIRGQLDELARAEVIAGEEGSAFHTIVLLRDIAGKKLKVFRRHGPEHPSFAGIAVGRPVDQTFYSCSQDAVMAVEGRIVRRLAPNPAQYLSHLGVRIPPPEPEVPPDRRTFLSRVTAVAQILGARTYLQIGTDAPALFDAIPIGRRDVVDTEFDFDVRSYRDKGAFFWECDPATFLAWFAKDRRYDLVVVRPGASGDGIRAVLKSGTHPRTVLLFDDVATPSEMRRWRPRLDALRADDTHRIVLELTDLLTTHTLTTIRDGDLVQTLAWPAPPRRRIVAAGRSGAPRVGSDISALRARSRVASEKRALRALARWVASRPTDPE